MDTMNWEIFGLVAGAITVSGFLPQIIKGYKTKSLKDLSYLLSTLIGVGMFMWVIYGAVFGSLSIILANTVGVTLNLTLLIMKYKYSKN